MSSFKQTDIGDIAQFGTLFPTFKQKKARKKYLNRAWRCNHTNDDVYPLCYSHNRPVCRMNCPKFSGRINVTFQDQEPLWKQFHQRFGEEYICLKCRHVTREKRENCPKCNGAMCVRLTSKVF